MKLADGNFFFKPSKRLTDFDQSPAADQDPIKSRLESASGPITAIVFTLFEIGRTSFSFLSRTIDFFAISKAASIFSGFIISAFCRSAFE